MEGTMGRWIIGIGLVAVISIGVLVFRDFLPSNAGELKMGDCFDVPTGDEVGDVQHHPCTDPHDGEVIFVGDFTGAAAYPTQDAFDAWVKTECIDKAFPAYVGASFDVREDIDLGYFYPKSEQWSKDKQMICYITPIPAGKVSVSFAKAAAPSGS
jgi:hypothetical protein